MAELPDMPGWCRTAGDLCVAKVHIRASADGGNMGARLSAALGCAAPAPNRFIRTGELLVAAIGPGEWLLAGDSTAVSVALHRAGVAFQNDAILALDITDGTLALRLSGAAGLAAISALSPIDLRPAHFPAGAALRTRLGDIGVFLAHSSDPPEILLFADVSYADYIAHLIRHGTRAA